MLTRPIYEEDLRHGSSVVVEARRRLVRDMIEALMKDELARRAADAGREALSEYACDLAYGPPAAPDTETGRTLREVFVEYVDNMIDWAEVAAALRTED